MEIKVISSDNRKEITEFIISHWFSTDMVIRGEIFDMVNLYHNALDTSRKLKPSIPLLGEFNIPLKHEIEFEMYLP